MKRVYWTLSFSTFFFVIVGIKENNDVILTRNDPVFIKKIMELEIPEVKTGIIMLEHVIREPYSFNKVIVRSNSVYIDPVGTCIGQSACRIKKISENLHPKERIEFVEWKKNERELLFGLFAPAKIISLIEKGKNWEVVVPYYSFVCFLKSRREIIKKIGEFLKKI